MGMFDIEILYMETCIGRDPIRIYFVKIEIFNWEVIKRPSFPSNQLSHLMNEVSTQPQFSFTSILCGYELNQPQNWSEHCFILPESTIKGTAWLSVNHLTEHPEKKIANLPKTNLYSGVLSTKNSIWFINIESQFSFETGMTSMAIKVAHPAALTSD